MKNTDSSRHQQNTYISMFSDIPFSKISYISTFKYFSWHITAIYGVFNCHISYKTTILHNCIIPEVVSLNFESELGFCTIVTFSSFQSSIWDYKHSTWQDN